MTRRRAQQSIQVVDASAVAARQAAPHPAPPTLIVASVSAVTADSLFVRLDDDRSEPASRSAGCLLEPREGDRVLCVTLDDGIAVLQVLVRDDTQEATLSVPGATDLALAQSRLAIRADDVAVDAKTATLRAGSSRLIGKAITAVADGLETVVKQLRRVADQEISSVNDSVRVVQGTDTLKARHVTYEAEQTMALRSHITVVDATGDVRVNGDRISLG